MEQVSQSPVAKSASLAVPWRTDESPPRILTCTCRPRSLSNRLVRLTAASRCLSGAGVGI